MPRVWRHTRLRDRARSVRWRRPDDRLRVAFGTCGAACLVGCAATVGGNFGDTDGDGQAVRAGKSAPCRSSAGGASTGEHETAIGARTRCSLPAFIRDPGMAQTACSRSISSHVAARASPERVAVRIANSSARIGGLAAPLVLLRRHVGQVAEPARPPLRGDDRRLAVIVGRWRWRLWLRRAFSHDRRPLQRDRLPFRRGADEGHPLRLPTKSRRAASGRGWLSAVRGTPVGRFRRRPMPATELITPSVLLPPRPASANARAAGSRAIRGCLLRKRTSDRCGDRSSTRSAAYGRATSCR